jgi:hypothetical protein
MSVDMSKKAVTFRLKRLSQLRKLSVSLSKAKKVTSTNKVSESKTNNPKEKAK